MGKKHKILKVFKCGVCGIFADAEHVDYNYPEPTVEEPYYQSKPYCFGCGNMLDEPEKEENHERKPDILQTQ